MRRKITSLLAVSLLSILVLSACGPSKATGGSGAKEKFVVGMEAAYAPFNWTQMDSSNGAVPIEGTAEYAGGYDVEMAKRVAEGLGRELVIVKTDWDGLLPALTSNTIDAIVAGMSPTPERLEAIDFTDFYYSSDLVMVVRKDGNYTEAESIQDFKGARITGQLNTSHYRVIDQINGVQQEPAFENFNVMRVALESGIIDGYVSERPEGISASAANENFMMIDFEEGKGFEASAEDSAISIGIRKNSDLTEQINAILEKISEEERQEIMNKTVLNQPIAAD